MIKNLEIKIQDSVFDPFTLEKKVYLRKVGESTIYKVWLFLEGEDLPYVESLKYKLHSTFKKPVRVVYRTPSNQNCSHIIWTWGIFIVRASIFDKRGIKYEIEHKLEYGKQLREEHYEISKSY